LAGSGSNIISITLSTFTTSSSTAGRGGLAYFGGTSGQLTLTTSTLSNQYAGSHGGAFYFASTTSNLVQILTGSVISSSSTSSKGGLMYLNGVT
jgi:hypothetical protein